MREKATIKIQSFAKKEAYRTRPACTNVCGGGGGGGCMSNNALILHGWSKYDSVS